MPEQQAPTLQQVNGSPNTEFQISSAVSAFSDFISRLDKVRESELRAFITRERVNGDYPRMMDVLSALDESDVYFHSAEAKAVNNSIQVTLPELTPKQLSGLDAKDRVTTSMLRAATQLLLQVDIMNNSGVVPGANELRRRLESISPEHKVPTTLREHAQLLNALITAPKPEVKLPMSLATKAKAELLLLHVEEQTNRLSAPARRTTVGDSLSRVADGIGSLPLPLISILTYILERVPEKKRESVAGYVFNGGLATGIFGSIGLTILDDKVGVPVVATESLIGAGGAVLITFLLAWGIAAYNAGVKPQPPEE